MAGAGLSREPCCELRTLDISFGWSPLFVPIEGKDADIVLGRSQQAVEKAESGHVESRLVRKAVRRAERGDMEALHFLYVRYAPDVLCCVRKLARDDHEAEEITQQVFSGLTGTIGTYEARKEPFIAWLSGVAHDAAREHVDTTRHSASRSM